jgi:succinate dehydrogenase/fumarate reductase cytochrome b subunit
MATHDGVIGQDGAEVGRVTQTPYRVRTRPERGTIAWALQRVSAYGLIVFLSVHMYFNHFAEIRSGNVLTFELVNRRFELYPVLYAINDIGLLTLTIFHGLNGVRNVFYDWVTSIPLRRIVSIALLIIGLVALWDGSLTLLALMQLPTTR